MGSESQVATPSQRSKWSPAIDAILKSGAAYGRSRLQRSIERVRKIRPDLSGRSILKRTAELKLTRWNQPWTEEDKAFVLENAREFPVSDLAKRLGRTPKAVYQLLWKSGESAKFQDGYTQRDLAEALRVSPRKVRQWVTLGWLVLYQGRVKDRSLKRFLEGHSDEIDPRRLESDMRLWLEDLGFHAAPAHSWQWFRNRKQTLKPHVCGRCGRKVYGNAFHLHIRACVQRAVSATNGASN